MQAAGNNVTGATVTVNGDVLTVTSSANSVTPLPFQNLGVLERHACSGTSWLTSSRTSCHP
jgi:hypothetical protein